MFLFLSRQDLWEDCWIQHETTGSFYLRPDLTLDSVMYFHGDSITKESLEVKSAKSTELLTGRSILRYAKKVLAAFRKYLHLLDENIDKDGRPNKSGWGYDDVYGVVLDEWWKDHWKEITLQKLKEKRSKEEKKRKKLSEDERIKDTIKGDDIEDLYENENKDDKDEDADEVSNDVSSDANAETTTVTATATATAQKAPTDVLDARKPIARKPLGPELKEMITFKIERDDAPERDSWWSPHEWGAFRLYAPTADNIEKGRNICPLLDHELKNMTEEEKKGKKHELSRAKAKEIDLTGKSKKASKTAHNSPGKVAASTAEVVKQMKETNELLRQQDKKETLQSLASLYTQKIDRINSRMDRLNDVQSQTYTKLEKESEVLEQKLNGVMEKMEKLEETAAS